MSLRVSAGCVAALLVLGGCGGTDSQSSSGGEVVVSGSSTVEPISVRVAESFSTIAPDVNVSVSGPGTGDGFKLFCEGRADIADASRPIKESEADNCAENGINYVELKVAVDGIAVLTSASNDSLECLAFGDLYALIGPESAGFENWSDANELAAAVGGFGQLPDQDLLISAPGTESGTYDSFVEIVLEDIAEGREQPADSRPDYSSSADDNVIIETISSNPSSIGWVGFAFASEASNVKLVPVSTSADTECVLPTAETIASNEYPIARDLYVYVNTDAAVANESLVAFVDHYMDFGLETAASEVGYVALTDGAKETTRLAWNQR